MSEAFCLGRGGQWAAAGGEDLGGKKHFQRQLIGIAVLTSELLQTNYLR